MKIRRQKCGTYFGGRDGKGTCDTRCQWYIPKKLCPNSIKAIRKGEEMSKRKKIKKCKHFWQRISGYFHSGYPYFIDRCVICGKLLNNERGKRWEKKK